MPTGCSAAVRMDREVDSDELALMLPTSSGQLKSSSLGVQSRQHRRRSTMSLEKAEVERKLGASGM